MNISMKGFVCISILMLVIGLTACGGDGDSPSGFVAPNISHEPVTITPENEKDVAQAGFDGNTGTRKAAGSTPFFPAGVSATEGNVSGNNVNVYQLIRSVVTNAIRNDLGSAVSSTVAGYQVSENDPCTVSGSESWSADIADADSNGPNSITAGDTMSITYNNCNNGEGDVSNGSMSITFNSDIPIQQLDSMDNIDFSMTVSFSNFSVTDSLSGTVTMHGGMSISMSVSGSNIAFAMSGDSFYIVTPAESSHLTNFDISVSGSQQTRSAVLDATFTIASTNINGQITVDSYLETAGYAAYPNSGYMNISGNNTQLNMAVVNSDSVTVELLTGGVAENGYPKTVSWADYGVEVNNVF